MAKNEIRINDIGTKFLITVKDGDSVVDISGTGSDVNNKRLIFKKPSTTSILDKPASFDSDGTNGKLYYTTVSGDLDEDGIWKLQAKVIIGSQTFHSDIHTFKVHRNL